MFHTIVSWFSKKFGRFYSKNSAGSIIVQAPKHPLLNLPDDEIIRKLREMSLTEMLKFSLISERCKDLMKSIQIEITSFHVTIGNIINVYITTNSERMELTFYTEPDMYWGTGAYGRKKRLTTPASITFFEYGPTVYGFLSSTLEKNDLTMQHWFKHLQTVFDYHKIDSIQFFNNSSQYDIDDIKEVFRNTTKVNIANTGCYTFNKMILRKFLPCEKLHVTISSFPNNKIPESILVQNFDELQIGHISETTIMPLDQLLLSNSKKVCIIGLEITAKQLNKFIRLWQRGSNPRMEHLTIVYTNADEFDNEVFVRRINHEIIPSDQIRQFKVARNELPKLVKGGIDIIRKDGVKATILLRGGYFPAVEMIVWFDHCIVES